MPRVISKPVQPKKIFEKKVHVSACLSAVGILSDEEGEYCGVIDKLYLDKNQNLVAEAGCGDTCVVANTKDQIKEIRDFLTEIIDAK